MCGAALGASLGRGRAEGVDWFFCQEPAHSLPRARHLRRWEDPPAVTPGQGRSDFLDALAVALDALVRDVDPGQPGAKTGRRRLILVSNFLSPHTTEDPGVDTFLDNLAATAQKHGVSLEVVSLDLEGPDEAGAAAKARNLRLLDMLCMEVRQDPARGTNTPGQGGGSTCACGAEAAGAP